MTIPAQKMGQYEARIKILEYIHEHPEISRAALVEALGLSAPSVSRIVDYMIKNNVLKETKSENITGGRPAISLSYNYQRAHNLIVTMHDHETIVEKVDLAQNILETKILDYKSINNITHYTEALIKILKSFEHYDSIFIAFKGIIEQGTIIQTSRFKDVHYYDMKTIIEGQLSTQVYIMNDIIAQAWGVFAKQPDFLNLLSFQETGVASVYLNPKHKRPLSQKLVRISDSLIIHNQELLPAHCILNNSFESVAKLLINNAALHYATKNIYISCALDKNCETLEHVVNDIESAKYINSIRVIEKVGLCYWALKNSDLKISSNNRLKLEDLYE